MDLNRQVQKAFLRLNDFYQSDLPSQELAVRLLEELNSALYELQTTVVELLEQNEELAASRNILEEERCRYQELFDFAPDGYLVTDMEGTILETNIAATKLFKVSRAFLIGKPLAMFVCSEEQLSFRTRLAVMKRSPGMQKDNWELDMLSEKRITFSVSITVGKVIPSRGKTPELRWLLRDNTERKQIEKDLCQSEEKFSKAFHGLPIMMSMVTLEEGIYLDVNEAWCSAMGYTREEVIGHNRKEIDCVDDVKKQECLNILTETGKIKNYKVDLRTKTGEIRNCFISGQLVDIKGKQYQITAIIDVTEKIRIDLAISRLDRLNLIGAMAASIGHEIRNPMTAVRGFLQMLSLNNEYAKDLTFFNLMIEELDRANEIISEYLNMAKDKIIDLQPRCLDEIIKSIYPLIQADTNLQNMTVRLEPGKPPMPLIDAKEIRQMILNMAHNGLEAMSPGGTLIIGTTVENSEIILYIKDEGHGVDSNIRDKLGTPFLTTKDTGIGLGLSVCYSIAARHNARIDIETGSGGTTFKICFPMP